jgi:hypothetical protein
MPWIGRAPPTGATRFWAVLEPWRDLLSWGATYLWDRTLEGALRDARREARQRAREEERAAQLELDVLRGAVSPFKLELIELRKTFDDADLSTRGLASAERESIRALRERQRAEIDALALSVTEPFEALANPFRDFRASSSGQSSIRPSCSPGRARTSGELLRWQKVATLPLSASYARQGSSSLSMPAGSGRHRPRRQRFARLAASPVMCCRTWSWLSVTLAAEFRTRSVGPVSAKSTS